MNILIVEDDRSKAKDLKSAIEQVSDVGSIWIASSYSSGMRELVSKEIHILILDMTIPMFDQDDLGGEGRKIQFGGELILQEMNDENLPQKVIVVSQYDYFANYTGEVNLIELGKRLKSNFGERVVDTILYDSSEFIEGEESGWRKQLRNAITYAKPAARKDSDC